MHLKVRVRLEDAVPVPAAWLYELPTIDGLLIFSRESTRILKRIYEPQLIQD